MKKKILQILFMMFLFSIGFTRTVNAETLIQKYLRGATLISIGDTINYSHNESTLYNAKYFKFTLSESGYLTINIESEVSIGYSLLDPSGEKRKYFVSGEAFPILAGTYYLEINATDEKPPFNVKITTAFTSSEETIAETLDSKYDTGENAINVELFREYKGFIAGKDHDPGYIGLVDDRVDVYKFTCPATGKYIIDCESKKDNSLYFGFIVTSDGNKTGAPARLCGKSYSIDCNMSAGCTYYLVFNNGEVPYTNFRYSFKIRSQNLTGFIKEESDWYYYDKGIKDVTRTDIVEGIVEDKNGWWYIKDGKVQFINSVEKNSNGWWCVQNGKVDFNYTGFAKNSNGWWYCEKGKVNFNKKDVIKGTVNGQSGWWYVSGGKVQFVNSVEKNSNGWWYIQNGKVDFNYTGFAKNSNGWWYCEKGKVNFNKKDVIKGTVNGQSGWWYVSGGKVQFVNSVEKNSNGWWYIQNGKVDFNYTGFAKNSNGWWYCEKGKVNFNKKDVIKGTVNGQSGWWYVSGGKVQFTDTVEKNSNGWWSIKNGKVDFSFTGIAKNSNGQWYCKGGKVQFSYSGTITYNGKKYNIKNGKVQ